ncbi:MAG: ComF family protein [Flavobacteriales bacterium]|nr:ComF family protein [Flavobacteriales bacterium]
MASVRNKTDHWFSDLLGLFLPRRCAACDDPLMQAERGACLACANDLPFTRFHDMPGNPVEQLFLGKVDMHAASALLRFNRSGQVKRMLHRLKYQGDRDIGMELGCLMAKAVVASSRFEGIDSVLPVPLHPSRLRTRGYNQAQLLVDGFREVWPLEPLANELVRTVPTPSQTRKGRQERWLNVVRAFELTDPGSLTGRHVLLIDDVITTGATMEACARALLSTPNVRVSAMVAAMA